VAWNSNCWALVLLQVYCWMAVPFAVPDDRASTHLPLFLLTMLYHVGPALPGLHGATTFQVASAAKSACVLESATEPVPALSHTCPP
jgi:hypothetical protein